MESFWIGALLIAATSLGQFVSAGQAQSVAGTGFSSSNTALPFPIMAVEPHL
jgi:hypothetical protein